VDFPLESKLDLRLLEKAAHELLEKLWEKKRN
jgi:hypothetical protein